MYPIRDNVKNYTYLTRCVQSDQFDELKTSKIYNIC